MKPTEEQKKKRIQVEIKLDDLIEAISDYANHENRNLKEALIGIIKNPHGCPMCDCGKLRVEERQHFDDCPFLIAHKVLAIK